MAKKKKYIKTTQDKKDSILLVLNCPVEDVTNIEKRLTLLRNIDNLPISIIIKTDSADKILGAIEKDSLLKESYDKNQIKVEENIAETKEKLLNIYSENESDYIANVDLSILPENFDYIDFVTQESKKKKSCTLLVSQKIKSNYSYLGIYIMKNKLADYLFNVVLPTSTPQINEIILYLKKLNIDPNLIEFEQTKDKNHNQKLYAKGFSSIQTNSQVLFRWFFMIPFSFIKNKEKTVFENEHPINRMLFVVISLVMLGALVIMSLDAGISGDEFVQYEHAKKVINFYQTFGKDTSSVQNVRTLMQHYGSSFDVVTAFINKIFNIENEYESRHVLNSITGWILILFTSLISVRLSSWRAGILTLLIIFFSPRILGHSLNNPKDIPFAMGYIIAIYYMILFLKQYPKFKIKYALLISVGIGIAISIRIGGLLIFAYLLLFALVSYITNSGLKSIFKNGNLQNGILLLKYCFIIIIVGYILGIILWPYALTNPIKNPISSLKIMTNYTSSIRQVFSGEIIWSDNVPWFYTVKYILITSPIIIFPGIIALFIAIIRRKEKYASLYIFILFFVVVFPISYIIYKESNVYGGWRHVLFAFPALASISGIGFDFIYKGIKNKSIYRITFFALFIFILAKPIIHTFKNHPHQYVYFNQFIGGIDGARGNYELDYYYHSLKEGAEWLAENNLKTDTASNIVVATNHGELVSYYLRDVEKAEVTYVRYYDRGNSNWDYAIIANSYINPYQQKNNYWPPENTIHTIDVDGVPIGAVIKRNNKLDYSGYQKLRKKDYFGAISDLQQALAQDKTNEVAYINLATAYMFMRRFDQAKKTINELLEIYPKYDKALNTLGLVYFNERNYEEAYKIFTAITELNPKFVSAYYNLGLLFVRMDKKDDAFKYFQKAIRTNGKYKPPYLAAARILKERGKEKEAQRYIDAANKLK